MCDGDENEDAVAVIKRVMRARGDEATPAHLPGWGLLLWALLVGDTDAMHGHRDEWGTLQVKAGPLTPLHLWVWEEMGQELDCVWMGAELLVHPVNMCRRHRIAVSRLGLECATPLFSWDEVDEELAAVIAAAMLANKFEGEEFEAPYSLSPVGVPAHEIVEAARNHFVAPLEASLLGWTLNQAPDLAPVLLPALAECVNVRMTAVERAAYRGVPHYNLSALSAYSSVVGPGGQVDELTLPAAPRRYGDGLRALMYAEPPWMVKAQQVSVRAGHQRSI